MSHFSLLTWRIQGIRHRVESVTRVVDVGIIWLMYCLPLCQYFPSFLVCSHLTGTLLGDVRSLRHGVSRVLPICGDLSTENHAHCLLPLLFVSRMEITLAFENTLPAITAGRWYFCQRENLPSFTEKRVAWK